MEAPNVQARIEHSVCQKLDEAAVLLKCTRSDVMRSILQTIVNDNPLFIMTLERCFPLAELNDKEVLEALKKRPVKPKY